MLQIDLPDWQEHKAESKVSQHDFMVLTRSVKPATHRGLPKSKTVYNLGSKNLTSKNKHVQSTCCTSLADTALHKLCAYTTLCTT